MEKVMHASEAAAWGAVLSRVQVFSIYPITPQTAIPEKLAEFLAKGYLNAKSIHTESEASAAASVMGASRVGARVFTATSSQGLWLMAEQIYDAGIRRLPLVMVNVNRTMGPPWNILLSHEDSLALRDIPWIQFYAANAQETLDSVILGYKIAEKVYLPVMINLDGFYLSHASEVVAMPAQERVDLFLPPLKPLHPIDFKNPLVFEPSIDDDYLTEFRYILTTTLQSVSKQIISEAHSEFNEIFGRKYESIEKYKMENVKMAIIALGSVAGTIKSVVDDIQGTGLIRIRQFRPFPAEELRQALAGVEKVAVIDRDMQGILGQEVRIACGNVADLRIVSVVVGLGGRDVDPPKVLEIIRKADETNSTEPIWIDLKKEISQANPLDFKNYSQKIFLSKGKDFLRSIPNKEYISPGEVACQGCSMLIASRYILKGLGPRTIEFRPASCASVINSRFPNCASLYNLQNVCFEEGAAEAAGARAGFDALGIKNVNVSVFAGDGGTYDIGLQALSGAAERNDDIIFACYDNEAYMNTGIQRSSSTPYLAWSSTTPGLKPQFKKDVMAIMAAHRIPYAAAASTAYPEDLLIKVRKAKKMKGCKFILVFCPCPTGWRYSPEFSVKVARQAVEARIFPLYEIFNGEKYVINKMPPKKPVDEYLKSQGRFGGLSSEDIIKIQGNVDKELQRLKKLSKLFN